MKKNNIKWKARSELKLVGAVTKNIQNLKIMSSVGKELLETILIAGRLSDKLDYLEFNFCISITKTRLFKYIENFTSTN